MAATEHNAVVARQFGEQANAYLTSAVHSSGEEFVALDEAVAGQVHARALDLGCGAGHVSFRVAPQLSEVVAYDLSQAMLDTVTAAAAERGLSNIVAQQGVAEYLPFADASFDWVFSRYSAHHWQDLGRALREVYRVLKPGGKVIFVDVMSPGMPLLDTYLQAVELLRDTSHVRDYSAAEWLQQMNQAGLQVERQRRQRLHLEFSSWVARMRTPQPLQQAVRALQENMGEEVRRYFEITADGSFSTDVIVLWAGR
ncbi:MAG: class I SAM-dependent methyltransferase [Halopseudomonas sp.]|uniref:class I SAM-dependent methyltransferase n=1 Tax=Halopseudomonas sp. TaxID=2901191 RepID=UPI003002778F